MMVSDDIDLGSMPIWESLRALADDFESGEREATNGIAIFEHGGHTTSYNWGEQTSSPIFLFGLIDILRLHITKQLSSGSS